MKEKITNHKKAIAIIGSSVVALAIVVGIVLAIVSNNHKLTNQHQERSYSISSTYAANTKTNKYETEADFSSRRSYEEILSEYRANKSTTEQEDYGYDFYDEDYEDDEYSIVTTKPTTTRMSTTKPAPFKTLSFSGSGKDSIMRINLPKGEYYIICTYNGERNFVAHFYYSMSDNYGDLIANFIDSGSVIYGFNGEASNGYINIDTTGSWTIKIERCESGSKKTNYTFNGSGTLGIKNINLPNGDYYITCNYNGERNFVAHFYYSTSDSYGDLIANFIDSGKDTYAFSGSATNGYINIDTTGSWTVTIEPA